MASPQIENGHTRIANELLEKLCQTSMSANQWRIILYVLRFTYGWQRTKHDFTYQTIADFIGIGKSSVFCAIKALEKRNIVIMQKNNIGPQKDYEKWSDSGWGGARLNASVNASVNGASVDKLGVKCGRLPYSKEIYKEIVQLETIPSDFQAFYDTYPRHAGKVPALKAWKRLSPSPALFSVIMARLKDYVVSVQGKESQFILLPATYLNGRRWEDELIKKVESKYA